MNLKITLFISAVLGLLFFSCYEDKGNYGYHDITEFSVTDFPGDFSVVAMDTLNVTIDIDTTGSDELTYMWRLLEYPNGKVIDTLGVEKDLTYIAALSPKSYYLAYEVRSKETDIVKNFYCTMSVTTSTATGWYVLKTIDGHTDMDYFPSDSAANIIPNCLDVLFGRTLQGKASSLTYVKYRWPFGQISDFYTQSVLAVLSEEDMLLMAPAKTEIVKSTIDSLMFLSAGASRPQRLVRNVHWLLFNDGKLYWQDGSSGIGYFGPAVPHPDGVNKDYYLHKRSIGFFYNSMSQMADYAPTSTVVWDELGHNFFMLRHNVMNTGNTGTLAHIENPATVSSETPSLRNMPYTLEYMGTQLKTGGMLMGTAVAGYALMKPEDIGADYLLLPFQNIGYAYLDLMVNKTLQYPITTAIYLDPTHEIVTSPLKVQNLIIPAMYYLKGNTVKSQALNDINSDPKTITELPSGETPVFMHMTVSGGGNRPQAAGTPLLMIGTTHGVDDYTVRVYEIDRLGGQGLLSEGKEVRVFQGKGVPAEICIADEIQLSALNPQN